MRSGIDKEYRKASAELHYLHMGCHVRVIRGQADRIICNKHLGLKWDSFIAADNFNYSCKIVFTYVCHCAEKFTCNQRNFKH